MADFVVDIGKLDKRITIQKFESGTNENGFPIEEWVFYKTVWASINNLFGKEYYAAKAVQSENTVEFLIRYSSDTKLLLETNGTKEYRIFWNLKAFNITFVDNIKYENKWLKIKAEVS